MPNKVMLLLAALILTTGSVGLLIVRLTNHRLKGLGFLGAAFATGGVSAGLLLSLNYTPPVVHLLLADLLVLVSYILLHIAVLELLDSDSLFPLFGSILVGVQVISGVYLIAHHAGAHGRVVVMGFIVAAQTAQTARLLLKSKQEGIRIAAIFSATVLGSFTVANVARSVAVLLGLLDSPQSFLLAAQATLAFYIASALGLAFGFFWMTTSMLSASLERMATTDPLTRTFNRRSFLAWCEREQNRTSQTGAVFSIMMIDLDHFKTINDNFGHQNGDRALCLAVERIQDSIRGIDILGRWGGEEFVVLLPSASSDAAMMVGERARANIERSTLRVPSANIRGRFDTIALTASVGVATYRLPPDRINDMLHRADKALYDAKAAGRNRVVRDGPPVLTAPAKYRVSPRPV